MHRSRRARLVAALLLAVVTVPAGASVAGHVSAVTAPCRVINVGTGARSTNLQTAITAAKGGARLSVTGTCIGSFSIVRGLTIEKGATAAVLQGAGGRVLTVGSTKLVTLVGLVIKGGSAASCGVLAGLRCGAGILNTGLLTLRDVTVSANVLDAGTSGDSVSGAGIFNADGARLTLIGATVKGNKATGADAAGGGIANRGRLAIQTSLIKGNAVTATTTVTGRATGGGIASVAESALAGLDGVTVSGNAASGPIALGGGIAVTAGDLDVWRSTISANHANGANGAGGGFHWGSPTGISLIADATISGNIAGATGGGVASLGEGLYLQGVTVTDNEAPGTGGVEGPAEVSSSIIAGNRGVLVASADDCTISAAGADAGDNLIGDGRDCSAFSDGVNGTEVGSHATPLDPVLGPLAANGGPTRTHALLTGSAAIDGAGADPCATDRDQRGTERPQRGACDVGAFELVP